jgi:hypothetical protein
VQIFDVFDVDKSGSLEFDEFYLLVRSPPYSAPCNGFHCFKRPTAALTDCLSDSVAHRSRDAVGADRPSVQACILISIKDNCEKQFLHYHWRTCFELLDVDGSKTITVRLLSCACVRACVHACPCVRACIRASVLVRVCVCVARVRGCWGCGDACHVGSTGVTDSKLWKQVPELRLHIASCHLVARCNLVARHLIARCNLVATALNCNQVPEFLSFGFIFNFNKKLVTQIFKASKATQSRTHKQPQANKQTDGPSADSWGRDYVLRGLRRVPGRVALVT